ncbi:MAG: NUDIX domain-containing protein [Nanoarchaeota archaeon]|nr:NUDIX domain-containing protein [Nanoarchaeota archaeon]
METLDAVAVLITNAKKDKFFFQIKDETYPRIKYRNKPATFGGKIEKEESPDNAINRELSEELGIEAYEIIKNKIKYLRDYKYIKDDIYIHIYLYEAVLEDKELMKLSKLPVNEGSSKLFDKKDIVFDDFVLGVGIILNNYIG